MFITGNPDRDFDRWDKAQADAINLLPRCTHCDEAIQDDFCYEIDGEVYCEECMKDVFRKHTVDLIM